MLIFLIVMCICDIFATVKCTAGHSLGALMYIKTNTQQQHQKGPVSGQCF